MDRFYYDTVARLVHDGWLAPDHRVLVVAGSRIDRDVLLAAGLRHVTVSNLDDRVDGEAVSPFQWSRQDAEALQFADASFDVCISHLGLHHCQSPHRGLLEMYRVARRGLVFFEPQETALTRLGVRVGLGQEYETVAVVLNRMVAGGVRNSDVPNFVYRWTAREAGKAIASFDPIAPPAIQAFYGLMVPRARVPSLSRPARLLARIAIPLASAVVRALPSQANTIAVVVDKEHARSRLHPWLRATDGHAVPDMAWFADRYRDCEMLPAVPGSAQDTSEGGPPPVGGRRTRV